MALAYYKVKPTYDAFSTIKVDPGDRGLFRENSSTVDFEVFKETQVKRVTNPNVIATALAAHPELLRLPRLALAQDPEAEIRKVARGDGDPQDEPDPGLDVVGVGRRGGADRQRGDRGVPQGRPRRQRGGDREAVPEAPRGQGGADRRRPPEARRHRRAGQADRDGRQPARPATGTR